MDLEDMEKEPEDHHGSSQPSAVTPVAPKRGRRGASRGIASAVAAVSNCTRESSRRASTKRVCIHGRSQAYNCRECGGAAFCEHGRVKRRCVLCGGSGVCPHRRRKERCRECGGKQVCPHGKRKQDCRDCGGSAICEHRHVRRRCKECFALAKCRHGNRLHLCDLCQQSGIFICEHLHERSACRECGGHALCLPHGKELRHCRECKGLPARRTPVVVPPPSSHARLSPTQPPPVGMTFNAPPPPPPPPQPQPAQQQPPPPEPRSQPAASVSRKQGGTTVQEIESEETVSVALADSQCPFGIPEEHNNNPVPSGWPGAAAGVETTSWHHFAPSYIMVGGHPFAYTLPELQFAARFDAVAASILASIAASATAHVARGSRQ